MSKPLLSGEQEYIEPGSDVDNRIDDLRQEFRQFSEQVAKAMAELRKQLNTMQRGLGVAAGDIPESEVSSSVAPQFDPRWEAWKQKLGPGTAPARVIDALLTQGPLNRTQVRQAGEMGWSTVDAALARLKNLSLIEKVGDRWNLKVQP
jgi:hypothetical protein